jgi:predicted transcriptional regulator
MTRPDAYWIATEAAMERARASGPISSLEGRTAVVQGRRYTGWQRFHPQERSVAVTDAWGKPAWLTPTQHKVWTASRALQSEHSERVSMARIANSLGVAVSTVYRALIRLASLGLVSYDTTKGRNGGIAFVHLTATALKERAVRAWDRIKMAREKAAQAWHSRLERSGYDFAALNVATITSSAQRLAYYSVGTVPWTLSELADAGL